jgi:hypothetical protein
MNINTSTSSPVTNGRQTSTNCKFGYIFQNKAKKQTTISEHYRMVSKTNMCSRQKKKKKNEKKRLFSQTLHTFRLRPSFGADVALFRRDTIRTFRNNHNHNVNNNNIEILFFKKKLQHVFFI